MNEQEHKDREELKDSRLKEQQDKKDYSYLEDGGIEKCDNCKSYINEDGHCPSCDY